MGQGCWRRSLRYGGEVIKGFMGDEQDPEVNSVLYWEPVKVGVMCSLEQVWASNWAAEFWTY